MAERMYKKVGKGSDRRLEPRLNKDDRAAALVISDALKEMVRDAYDDFACTSWLEAFPETDEKLRGDDNFATAFEIEVFKYFYRRK